MREHSAPGGPVWLSSELLAAPGGAAHAFSTRLGGVSEGVFSSLNLGHTRGDRPEAVRENYRRLLSAAGMPEMGRLVLARQVHGDALRVCTGADAGKGLDRPRDFEADGLMTDERGLTLAVFTADCIPILLYDPVRRAVAAVHAGWRGTALGIAAKAVRQMADVYGCRPEHLRAAIGPGISRCCFETDGDVPEAMRRALGAEAEQMIFPVPGKPGRWRVDLKALNEHWLRRAGVREIDRSDECTHCYPERYWSHRRTGPARGSMAALITLT